MPELHGVLLQVKAHFRPEFVNRVDDFVVFEALKLNEIKQIVPLQAKRVEDRLRDKKMRLELTDSAIDYLAVSPFTETRVTWAVRRHSSGVSCRADLADSWLLVPAHLYTWKQISPAEGVDCLLLLPINISHCCCRRGESE